MNSSEQYVRTNLTIAASGQFKHEVLRLALENDMTLSQFVRSALGAVYPCLQQVDRYSEYALKRNVRLREIQKQLTK